MPLGPRVLLTRSPIAMEPTKAERRAFSDFSIVASSENKLAACVSLVASVQGVPRAITADSSEELLEGLEIGLKKARDWLHSGRLTILKERGEKAERNQRAREGAVEG